LASFTEGPVKHNHSPNGTRCPTTKYVGPKLIVPYLYSPLSHSGNAIGWMTQMFPTPLSFSAIVQGDTLQINGKALRFLKLKSSRQPTVKIWWF